MKDFSPVIGLPKIRVIVYFLMFTCVQVFGQDLLLNCEDLPIVVQRQLAPKTFIPKYKIKLQDFKNTDWSAIIDSTWGEGLPTEQKLGIFDTFWNAIDRKFALT